jgi:hypothetical protein
MDETVYLLTEGGIVAPISHVSANRTESNVVIYDGETYIQDLTEAVVIKGQLSIAAPTYNITALTTETAPTVPPTGALSDGILKTGTGNFYSISDTAAKIAPRYKGKQATLWSFPRTISAVAAFTHVAWAHLVQLTCSHPPFRVGGTPPTIS